MSARSFVVRGLIAGLLAGIATFLVAYVVGEPQIDAAIAIEEGTATNHHSEPDEAESEEDDPGTVVSRQNQKTWGLITGTVPVGVALGGVIGLIAAATLGRLGRLMPAQSTAVVSLIGFISFSLVPFLKYPSTPPAVGEADTVGTRTALYFGFLLVSVVAAAIATYAAMKLRHRSNTYTAIVVAAVGYVVVMVVAGNVFATVNEIGEFPGDILWFYRRATLFTLATMWAVIGVVLTGLVGQLYRTEQIAVERRQRAATL